MTNEELVLQFKKTKDEKYFNELFKRNESLINKVLYKRLEFNQIVISREDMYSQCLFGFVKAVNNFEVDKNIKFSTFATLAMDNEIKVLYRTINMQKRICDYAIIPIHSYITKDDSTLTIEETISDEYGLGYVLSNYTIESDENELYRKLSKKLSRFQVETLKLLNEGLSQKDIAIRMNKSHQNVSASVKHIRKVCVECGYRL